MRRRVVGLALSVHPFPVLVVVATSAFMLAVVNKGIPSGSVFIRAVVVVFLSQVAVGSLNDYVDRKADARMQPVKPIPRGLITAEAVLKLSLISLALLLPVSFSLGWRAALLALLGTAAGLIYDLKLKGTPLSVAGYVVGFLSLFTWVCIVDDRFPPWIIFAYLLGPPLITAAHLAQSLPDIETDRALGQRGLAVVFGYDSTRRVVLACYSINALAAFLGALIRGSPLALVLAGLSLMLLASLLAVSRRPMLDRRARVRFFRLVAPGLALSALSSLITLAA